MTFIDLYVEPTLHSLGEMLLVLIIIVIDYGVVFETWSYYVDQADLKLVMIYPSLPTKNWE